LLALDVDGVLIDPWRGGRGPWQLAFGERFGVDAADLDETLFATAWSEVIVGRRPVESALAEALHELGWDMGVEAALQCWFEEDFVLEPAVITAAAAWAELGIPLALVSNQERRRARYLEERLAQVLPLSGVAFSGDLGLVKTDPDFYNRARAPSRHWRPRWGCRLSRRHAEQRRSGPAARLGRHPLRQGHGLAGRGGRRARTRPVALSHQVASRSRPGLALVAATAGPTASRLAAAITPSANAPISQTGTTDSGTTPR
jgi:hypothetical protein